VSLLGFLKRIFARPGKPAGDKLAANFGRNFGYLFNKSKYLLEALTHRSYIHYSEEAQSSNERLELLGDSVLGLVVAEYLFNENPQYNEGDMTKKKAMLVNEMALAMTGKDCGLNNYILMSPEEEQAGGRDRNSIISDAMEAVIGAIYLDSGLAEAKKFIYRVIISQSEAIFADTSQRNFKGELLEFLQHRGEAPPVYEVISEVGPDHEKTFEIAVRTNGEVTGSGIGNSKKAAEQKAAAQALKRLTKRAEKEAKGKS